MTRQSARYAFDFWNSHTKDQADAVLATIPHTQHYFNGNVNNRSNANNSQDVYSSLVETITNGNDAVIMDHINTGFFETIPSRVRDAVDAINATHPHTPKANVFVMVQNRAPNSLNTVTVIDNGSGIEKKYIEKTILAYSSNSKLNSPYLHGTYGQGGSATLSFSDGQLIITRSRNSKSYYWTYIWTVESDNSVPSYVYLKNNNNELFSFTEKDMRYVEDYITTDGDIDGATNKVVLPVHGTLRRMIGMAVDGSSDRATSIFRILPDKMFGTNCYTRVITDKEQVVLTGRRVELDSGIVGQKINTGESPVLLDKINDTPLTVIHNNQRYPVVVRTWFVDNFKRKNKDVTGIRGFLSNDPKNAAASIFVTYNGQTHALLTNKRILSDAGFNSLVENMIVEVRLDGFTMSQINKATVSNRETLKKDFELNLGKAISDFAEGDDTFAKYNAYFASAGATNETLVRDLNEIIQTEMLGSIASIQSFGRGSGGNSAPSTRIAFVPSNPPTRLEVYGVSILPGQTAWVTIKTNAPDHYGPSINTALSGFVRAVNTNPPELRNGVMRFQIICDPNTSVGTLGTVAVSLGSLSASAEIKVVAKKRKKNLKSTVPNVIYVKVDGKDDIEYIKAFPGITDDQTGSLNYRYDENSKTLTVFENTKTPELIKTKGFLEKHSKGSSLLFDKIISIAFTSAAMMVNKVGNYGSGGASDAESHEMLSAIGVSYIGTAGTVMKKYILEN